MKPAVPFALALALAAPCTFAKDHAPADSVSSRHEELRQLDKQTFRKTLLARQDFVTELPSRQRATELLDGSYYEHADPSIAYEELTPVMIQRTSLRKDGSVLLVMIAPPSRILPPQLAEVGAPDIGLPLLVEVNVDEKGGVRQALESVVYLPGESPDAETLQRCLSRYPQMSEERSRMRCGQGRPQKQ